MTEMSPVGESELHAHADGHLPIERIPAVEAFLAADPLARARVAAWRTQNELIGRLYEPAPSHPRPERLAVWRLRARSRRSFARTAAAAVVALSLGLAGGWWARGLQTAPPTTLTAFARMGVELHRMAAQGMVDSPLESDPHQLAASLTRALGHPVTIPDLAGAGLQLVGGRDLPIATGASAAQLVYADHAGIRFALYLVRPETVREPAGEPLPTEDLSGLAWSYEEFHCLLIADVAPERLTEVSRIVQSQLDAGDDRG